VILEHRQVGNDVGLRIANTKLGDELNVPKRARADQVVGERPVLRRPGTRQAQRGRCCYDQRGERLS
jgi:hypothetical protein